MKASKSAIRRQAARYPKFVEWSDEDECYVGRCPTLFEGGIHGHDEVAVYRRLCKVAEEWVELLTSRDSPLPRARPPKKVSGKLLVRLPPSLHERLALKAVASGESLNTLIVQALMRS